MIRSPIPQRDNNVPLNARRAWRLDLRRFTLRDAIRPVGEHLESVLPVEAVGSLVHLTAANTGLQSIVPGFRGSLELRLRFEDVIECSCDRVSELMAEIAAGLEGMHPSFETLLTLPGSDGECRLGRRFQHLHPIV